MVGKESRFVDDGYTVLKPLVDVSGEPMICVVTKNIVPLNLSERTVTEK